MQLFPRGKHAENDVYRRLAYDPDNNTIAEEIKKARQEIENAYNNFQNASDPDMIDCYIYEGNAAWKRYHFLLKQIRDVGNLQNTPG